MSASNHEQNDLLRQVTRLAGTDPHFRARLLADPAAAVSAAFGVILPHDFRLRVMEQPADVDALVVLPPVRRTDELDEDDLDMVAGGADTDPTVCAKW